MARQKKSKNELDAILEQLKRSYGSESSDLLEDDLLESPDREEDVELNEILSKIFSSNDENKIADELRDEVPSVEIANTVLDQDIYREFVNESNKNDENSTAEELSAEDDAVEETTTENDIVEEVVSDNNAVEETVAEDVTEEENSAEALVAEDIKNIIEEAEEALVDTVDETPDEIPDEILDETVLVEESEKLVDLQDVIEEDTEEDTENEEISSDIVSNEQAVEDVLNIMFANKTQSTVKGKDVIFDMAKVDDAPDEFVDLEESVEEATESEIIEDSEPIETIEEIEIVEAVEDLEEAQELEEDQETEESHEVEEFQELEERDAYDDIDDYEDESDCDSFAYVDENDNLITDQNEDFAVEDEEYDVVSFDDDDDEIADIENDIENYKDDVEDIIEEDVEEDVEDEEYVIEDYDSFTEDPEFDDFVESEPEIEVIPEPIPELIPEPFPSPKLVLNPEDYTDDPLQEIIPSFGIEKNASAIADKKSVAEPQRPPREEKKTETFDENDISMLLNFGYGNEIKSKIGEKKAQEVLLKNDSKFTADTLEKPFGFCGKELTDRSQLKGIKAKYRSNLKVCVAMLSVISIISFLIAVVNLIFEFIPDRITGYPALLTIEFTLVLLTSVILYKKLISGVIGILKFEMKSSSIFSFVVLLYGGCSLASLVIYFINYSAIDPDSLMMFGFCISWYAMLLTVSDLLTCIKEYNTFKIIESSDEIYIAEKQNTFSPLSRRNRYKVDAERVYKIRKTSLVSGYFRKTSQSDRSSVKPIYLIGIVPIISLVIGGICFFFGKSLNEAVSVIMFTAMLCLPIGYVCMPSIVEYVTSRWIRNKKVAFIGNVASDEMSKAELIILKDNETVDITSYTEIQPNNRTDIKTSLNIAYELFAMLGGPLASMGDGVSENKDKEKHDIVINQVNDHGIDVYFDSTMSILLGDKQYMQSHNIKVKTDGNLSTAVRGVDRAVLYMAFDGVPKLGFIVNSRIKAKFLRTANALSEEGIRVLVETYEPQINALYYEQNKGDCSASIGVIKPEFYEGYDSVPMCDGCVISGSDALNLAQAIGISKEIHRQKSLIGIINLALSACGVAVACLLTVLTVTGGNQIAFFEFLSRHMTVLFGLTMFAGLIPGIVEIIRMSKRKK